jgi:hypothetical protein
MFYLGIVYHWLALDLPLAGKSISAMRAPGVHSLVPEREQVD